MRVNLALVLYLALVFALALDTNAQSAPTAMPTEEKLADDNKLFLSLATMKLKWEEPTEPVHVAGPLYFVGTKGLGVFLFATPEGHILMNTGMPSSGPLIVESINKLDLKPEDIKVMINGHAHIDHAGALAYLKQRVPGAELAVMREDVPAMESGDKGDFKYADDLVYPGVKVDRVLRDGDTIEIGDVQLTAISHPGILAAPPPGSPISSTAARRAFPAGAGFNPGYRLVKNPSYPGIADDYRRTHHVLEMLKPDIWLAQHNEYYDLEGKRARAATEGVKAWIDPEGFRRWVASKSALLKIR